jgi:hypothetical protein
MKRSQKGALRPGLAVADRIATRSVQTKLCIHSQSGRVSLTPALVQSATTSHNRHAAKQGPTRATSSLQ